MPFPLEFPFALGGDPPVIGQEPSLPRVPYRPAAGMADDLSDVIEMLSSGGYTVQRLPPSVFERGVLVQPVAAQPWEPLVSYPADALVSWPVGPDAIGETFIAVQSGVGVSSADQPPSGRFATGISDGSVLWDWHAPALYEFDIVASVQPLRGEELDRLPENLRTKEVKVLFTRDVLKVAGTTTQGDLVEIDGEVWEVSSVERWDALANFTKCLVARRGR